IPAYEEDLSEFARYDAQVLGLSIDTIPTIKAWAKSLGSISYPLLSDFWPHGLTALKYGVLRTEGFTERAIFIIDKKGIIRYIDVHPIGDNPNDSEPAGPPRALYPKPFQSGSSLGNPNDVVLQMRILRDAFGLIHYPTEP